MTEVRVSAALAHEIVETFGPEDPGADQPSEWNFWSGPLAAALFAFRQFEGLRFSHRPEIRSLHLVDPLFGPIVFVGVLIEPDVVVLDTFAYDPDYWAGIEDDPDD
jgi:hypothetical protein